MKFNGDTILIDRQGKPVREPEIGDDGKIVDGSFRTITHGLVALSANDATLDIDKGRTAEQFRKAWVLGTKLAAGGMVDLTAKEAAVLQERIAIKFASAMGYAAPVIIALDNDAIAEPANDKAA